MPITFRVNMNQKFTLLIGLIVGAMILSSGCLSSDLGPGATPPPTPIVTTAPSTPVPTPVTSTPVVTPPQTEDVGAIRTQLNTIWRQIQVAYDTYQQERDKLDLSDNDDINYLRQKSIPDAITDYQTINDTLGDITINNADLGNERDILLSICAYKIKFLEGLEAAYHAPQIETYDTEKSLDEYKSAKYLFQDVLDIIHMMGVGITPLPGEKEPSYVLKYWDYIYNDKESAKDYINWADENISRALQMYQSL